MTQRFDLVLTGRVLPGQSREAVAAGLAKLLHIDEARALAILSGRETIVKRGQTREALEPFVDALTKIGAEPGLRAPAPAAPPAASGEPAAAPAAPAKEARSEARQALEPKRAAMTLTEARPITTPDEDTRPWILTFYKKSLLVEILVLLILTLWWATCAMIDPHRGKLVRGVAALLFALMAFGVVLRASGFLDVDREAEALDNAFAYAGEVVDKVGSYAIENQRMPDDAAALSLPPRPPAVKAVDVRHGTVQLTLADDLGESSGGAIVVSPDLKEGVISWSCSARGIPERYLDNCR